MSGRMKRIARRAVLIVALAGLQGLTVGNVAWAKGKKPAAPEVAVKSYVLPYALTILGVALGMIVVLRPVKRADEPKRNVKEDS